MDKGKKAVITVLVDFVLLALIVFSVYRLLFGHDSAGIRNLFTAFIVLAIPVMFYITYMALAGDKFDDMQGMFDEDGDEGDSAAAGEDSAEEAPQPYDKS